MKNPNALATGAVCACFSLNCPVLSCFFFLNYYYYYYSARSIVLFLFFRVPPLCSVILEYIVKNECCACHHYFHYCSHYLHVFVRVRMDWNRPFLCFSLGVRAKSALIRTDPSSRQVGCNLLRAVQIHVHHPHCIALCSGKGV